MLKSASLTCILVEKCSRVVLPRLADYQPLLLNMPAQARPMKPRYPNISPALLSPASMVPMVCWYRFRFVLSVLSAFCNRISGVSNVSERGDCRRCDSVHQPIFLGLREMTDLKLDIQAQVQFFPCTIPALLPLAHYTAPSSAHAVPQ